MSDNTTKFTPKQQQVIDSRNRGLLVSASAGTGKTTVMIERVVALIEQGADVGDFVIVTFTNLAAAEMKTRLSARMSAFDNPRMAIQREKLDTAAICTLHSFCGSLLKNYFYVVDVDPSFVVLDSASTDALKKAATDELFDEYFQSDDQDFYTLYRIFAANRNEDRFRSLISELYEFGRNQPNFETWYAETRNNLLNVDDPSNPFVEILLNSGREKLAFFAKRLKAIATEAQNDLVPFADVIRANAELCKSVDCSSLEGLLYGAATLPSKLLSLPRASKNDSPEATTARALHKEAVADVAEYSEKCQKLLHGKDYAALVSETKQTVAITDKLAEIVIRFEQKYYAAKKERGGIDFGDLEHLTLALLDDEQALAEIKARYKLIFVDEYQDTNPVQEAIISKIAQPDNLFMVGDVKQSIYGFRGCEPNIFVQKYLDYKHSGSGEAIELNDNFRSNRQILDFVNDIFDLVMTPDFGKVDYKNDAELSHGNDPCLPNPSVSVDFVLPPEKQTEELTEIYDIAKPQRDAEAASQGKVIADVIRKRVGQTYLTKEGETRTIGYNDVVILMRSLTGKAIEIYNTLLEENLPVVATFKVDGAACKEVRDVINFLRVTDNPLNDIPLVGVCLSCFGGFTESELTTIRLDTQGRTPFYERLVNYKNANDNEISTKIHALLTIIDKVRFFACGANVNDTVMYLLKITDYPLYVSGLPSGALRLSKLYAFADKLKGATYGQSVDKFLAYLDGRTDSRDEERTPSADAVRMMTMHASKGLEFPVVIIAGTETKFNFDHNEAERNSELGLATKFYDQTAMTVAPTLCHTACALLNRNKQREEEMRLLYVALTRAKFALHVIGTTTEKQLDCYPKLPSDAACHQDWITAALKNKYGEDFLTQSSDKLSVRIVDKDTPLLQKAERQNNVCKQTEDEKSVTDTLNYVYPYASQTEMPIKVVSSALDKEYVERTEIADDPDQSRERTKEYILHVNNNRASEGTAYHKVLERAPLQADYETIDKTISELISSAAIDPSVAEKLDRTLIFNALNDEKLLALAEGGELHKEIAFMTYAPYDLIAADKRFSDSVLLQGVIDLLIKLPNRAVVIDYKYTRKNEKQIVDSYKMQLSSYRLAVRSIGIEDVDCYVYSIESGKLIKID